MTVSATIDPAVNRAALEGCGFGFCCLYPCSKLAGTA